jgi:hypothetical protein
MMEHQHRQLLIRHREATESRRESTEHAIYALMSLRDYFTADEDSKSVLKAWVAEDERLRIKIHNYDEFLKL